MKDDWDDILSKFDKPAPDAPTVPGRRPLKNAGDDPEPLDGFNLAELKSTTWHIGGEDREFYSIGELAKAIGRTPVTVRSWESKGWLPAPRFRTPSPRAEQLPGKAMKGKRLYSAEQVLYLVSAVRDFNLVEPQTADWDGFHRRMKQYPKD
jgi:hypothetical protein